MKQFTRLADWHSYRAGLTVPLGFVPTMGALHEGHRSLLQRSTADNALTVASIYVNPTQFNKADDLKTYPRTLEQDLVMLEEAGVDAVLLPTYDELYPDGFRFQVTETELSKRFCGAHRPGHFTGVLSVVLKLLNLVAPSRAYFGEKDYQQLLLIRGMATAFHLPVEIIGCPTLRENDGLAMSSRNLRLNQQQRKQAAALYRSISTAKDNTSARASMEQAGFVVDYVEDYAEGGVSRRLAAASLGDIRLIDNVPLN